MSARRMSAWFLGPKAENAEWERKMISHILEDYFHWRRNYFPADEMLITESIRREQVDFHDRLAQQLDEMLAGLRAHFPFYSPRYNAHMLSDQTIPAVLGYFAGLLYNPNNVTPESGPVTLKWELEVGADVLRMLGYAAPPKSGETTREEFGWAHVTGGGTVANLEALWIARNVRYFPLSVRDVCRRHKIPLTLKLPHQPETPLEISEIAPERCLGIRPNQAIYLHARYIDAVRRHWELAHSEAIRCAHELLAESEFHIAHQGPRAAYAIRPPVLLASDARHYSITKAADILGIGSRNIVLVDTDATFRMDVRSLEAEARRAIAKGRLPIAVTAIAGTTEEGAVDPVDRVAEFRERIETEIGESFWLHIDAAWGGYFRALFCEPGEPREASHDPGDFVSRDLTIERGRYSKRLRLRWGASEVLDAFRAFSRSDSIAVDPHKMGYIPYPCGIIAYKNDLARQFANEEIPYISSSHLEDVDARRHRAPDTIGPYILEGSKPGASVAACWLSHRMIPPDRSGYGEIVRASLLGAREFYERIVHWEAASRANGEEHPWRFVPISALPPDTNIVCFLIQTVPAGALAETNAVNRRVYEAFTIPAKDDQRTYSYSQPFF
ncbi:MAG TPA: pyridoxal-dependent decarboxylase, partial [Bryobacteraceae bacterium]|nr:pyridoxal-dependent decarboxylase [Bryobacteraceae bacterium]